MKPGEKVGIGIIVVLLGFFFALTFVMESQRKVPDVSQAGGSGRSAVVGFFPQGFTPENLPEPESRGAKALGLYCVQCHELPIPSMHTAQEWEAILARMRGHMDDRSGGLIVRLLRPSEQEEGALAEYLSSHALRGIDLASLPEGTSVAGSTYATHCATCHAIPDPQQHTGTEWARVLLRMRSYMETAGRALPSEAEMAALREYLARVGVHG